MTGQRNILVQWMVPVLLAAFIVGTLGVTSLQWEQSLRDSSQLTGYSLLAIMLLLALFNVRKRLAASPLLSARAWLRLHAALGVSAILIYLFHAPAVWPHGLYEQVLAALFFTVSFTGLLGYVIQRQLPKRLAQIPDEFIFERIPAELATMRENVEQQLLLATRESGADTLGRHYLETLNWYFQRPRFGFGHLWGSRQGEAWLNSQIDGIARYLDDAEREHLEAIRAIGLRKTNLDAHYAIQGTLKLWLFAHVPLVAGLLLLSFWHLFIVNIYIL
ncbi:MAG: hypothetical protein ACPG4N_03375 [Gammaproteobacteria bacterium]